MAQKYIIGDIVMYKNRIHTIIDISASNRYELSYVRHPVSPVRLSSVPLTTEILEKNGWKNLYEKFFEKNVNDIRLTIEFSENIYVAINRIFIMEIHYVHKLQHLLFGLGINHEMEV